MSEKSPLDRRSFLQGAAAASLTAAAASSFPSGVRAAGSDEVRIALIGCGGRGTGAASQAMRATDGVKLWAMADIDAKNLEQSRQILEKGGSISRSPDGAGHGNQVEVPAERRFLGLDAYRAVMALPEVDVVILTTPPGFRPIHFAAAVEAGKHVFMEKPVAVDSTGIRRVLESAKVAKAKNLKVGVGLNRRHSSMHEDFIPRLQDGVIGDLHTIRLYNCRNGVAKIHLRQPGETELEYQIKNWYYFTWLSGDFIAEQSVHEYDVVRWIKGDANPVQCQGQGGRLVRTGAEYGHIYDHFDVEYEFADGSVVITQHRHIPHCWSYFGEKITGTKGKAELASKSTGLIQLYGQDQPLWRGRESDNSYQVEHDRLFKAIREDLPFNEAERGAHSSLMAIMGRMAAYTCQVVTWEEALNAGEDLVTAAESWDAPAPVLPGEDGRYPVALPGKRAEFRV